MILRRMRLKCWLRKVTDTHSEYVMLIAFPLQQLLHERTSLLRYTYIACLVCCIFELQVIIFSTCFRPTWIKSLQLIYNGGA